MNVIFINRKTFYEFFIRQIAQRPGEPQLSGFTLPPSGTAGRVCAAAVISQILEEKKEGNKDEAAGSERGGERGM